MINRIDLPLEWPAQLKAIGISRLRRNLQPFSEAMHGAKAELSKRWTP